MLGNSDSLCLVVDLNFSNALSLSITLKYVYKLTKTCLLEMDFKFHQIMSSLFCNDQIIIFSFDFPI